MSCPEPQRRLPSLQPPRTLRGRVAFYFCGYLALLLAAYSGALIFILNASEDRAFNRQLMELAERLPRHLEAHGRLPAYLPPHISAHMGLAQVPPALKPHVQGHGPGVFEIDAEGLDFHVAVVSLSGSKERLYLLYDVGSLETSDRFESYYTLILVSIALGVLLLGWVLAGAVSNRILGPITALAARVQGLRPEEEAAGAALRAFDTTDEVGTLAQKIDQLLSRIAAFTRREREFTAHASHELRTPVTVIRGALELIRGRAAGEDALERPLDRIHRSVGEMEMLIDTFLLLARQGQMPDADGACDLAPVVRQVVDAHEELLTGKAVEVVVRTETAGRVAAPPAIVTIALGNLVRNAFKYTRRGRVEIVAGSHHVCVKDSGPGFDIKATPQGSGLGLAIVERLCERTGWRFTLSGAPGEGTSAELSFTSRRQESGAEKDSAPQE